jgi:thiamine biosynthesis lipoprotein
VLAETNSPIVRSITAEDRPGGLIAVCFQALGGPCEVLLATSERSLAFELGTIAAREAWRIEQKFSRYRDDSVIAQIHRHRGASITVDPETASLLDFAGQCYRSSAGLFDITSGVLREVWHFDGSDRVPGLTEVARVLPLVGFSKVQWQAPRLLLPVGMEIDFGGFGKEYAVDRAYELLAARRAAPFLVNLGGDLRANHQPPSGGWQIGVEQPESDRQAALLLQLDHGALATSGDSKRFLLKDGVRYGHVLDPRTGWPVPGAPRSVTVAASSCIEAGLISTLALLHGAGAREFLDDQGIKYWIVQ